MTETPTVSSNRGFAGRLRRTRFATRAAMMLERLWPLALPFVVIVSLFLSLSWLGVFREVADAVRLPLAVLFAGGALAALYPLRFFRSPTTAEIDRRIERANQLPHTPVLVQTDRLTGKDDSFGQALWQEHQRRMAERLGSMHGDLPRTTVPERDPWALRAVAALVFVAAFAFSLGPLGGSITDAFRAHVSRDVIPARIDAWVTPPAYTGKPPVFLTADAAQPSPVYTVPEGSDVALRITGGTGEETLGYTRSERQYPRPGAQRTASTTGSGHAGGCRARSAAAVCRQAQQRRRSRFERGRAGARQMVVFGDPRQGAGNPIFR